MTKNEKAILTREIRGEISRTVYQRFLRDVEATVAKRINEVSIKEEEEANYTNGREGKLWTPNEEAVLRQELNAAINMISIAHRRKMGGITSRLRKLGILTDYSLTGL